MFGCADECFHCLGLIRNIRSEQPTKERSWRMAGSLLFEQLIELILVNKLEQAKWAVLGMKLHA